MWFSSESDKQVAVAQLGAALEQLNDAKRLMRFDLGKDNKEDRREHYEIMDAILAVDRVRAAAQRVLVGEAA